MCPLYDNLVAVQVFLSPLAEWPSYQSPPKHRVQNVQTEALTWMQAACRRKWAEMGLQMLIYVVAFGPNLHFLIGPHNWPVSGACPRANPKALRQQALSKRLAPSANWHLSPRMAALHSSIMLIQTFMKATFGGGDVRPRICTQ